MFEARVSHIPEPQGDWTILKLHYEHTTKGGIIVPQSAYDATPSGEVMAVGPGRRNEMTGQLMPMSWKPGDIVLVNGVFVDLGSFDDGNVIQQVPALLVPGKDAPPPQQGARLVAVQERSVIAISRRAGEEGEC